jgi:hypothetical protein
MLKSENWATRFTFVRASLRLFRDWAQAHRRLCKGEASNLQCGFS